MSLRVFSRSLGLAFGNLNNGVANGGLSYLNGNNALSNSNWNYLARLSEVLFFHYAVLAAAKIECEYTGLVGKRTSGHTKERTITLMKRSCKNIDLRDYKVVMPWVEDCCMRHKLRYDFRSFFRRFGMSREEYENAVRDRNRAAFLPYIEAISKEACRCIAEREFNLPPVQIKTKVDATTGKIREIGCESPMQQIFDYIAVHGAKEIFDRRLVVQQASSVPGRGQVYGVRMIKWWIDEDNRAMRYASDHNIHYTRKCKYFVKLDIRKCYPSANTDIFLSMFRKDCANEDLYWLWEQLILSHRVGEYTGFMIGALNSQWACQYLISFIYRHAMNIKYKKRGKEFRSVKHMNMFMDDMLLTGSNRSQLKKAVESTIKFTKDELGWDIKPNWHIKDIDQEPIDMMGYVVHANGKVTIRARDFVRSRRMVLRQEGGYTIQQARRLSSQKGFYMNSNSRSTSQSELYKEAFKKAQKTISEYDRRSENAKGILQPGRESSRKNQVHAT